MPRRFTLRRSLAAFAVFALSAGALAPAAPAGARPVTPAAAPQESYNGLALTPPMGFNDWAGFECNSQMNEQLFVKTADAIVNLGLNKRGYDYVNIDDCWMQQDRDANGNLQVDTTRFPHGMKWLGDYIHSKGLKFGIYEDAGYKTCQGAAGSYGHFQADADQYASWGVDYLKLDYCYQPLDQYPGKTQSQVAEIVYTQASQALLNTGRPIVFSESAPAYVCCSGPDFDNELTWLGKHGNLWRFGSDIADNWGSVIENYTEGNTPGLAQWAGPGHWNDADMFEIGNGGLTPTEEQSQFTLWAEMAVSAAALDRPDQADAGRGGHRRQQGRHRGRPGSPRRTGHDRAARQQLRRARQAARERRRVRRPVQQGRYGADASPPPPPMSACRPARRTS